LRSLGGSSRRPQARHETARAGYCDILAGRAVPALHCFSAVRTTLKRGIGRDVAANGNGHAGVLFEYASPIARYRQPDGGRRGLRLLGRILLWLAAFVVMLAAAFAGGIYLFFHESIAATRPHTKSEKRAAAALDVPVAKAPAIALVIGYDHRFGEQGPSRSDTIMLVRADPATHSISMLSFPRDLSVPIYCGPGDFRFRGKINAAYATCKEPGALETVRQLTGLRINYLITVNFRGFKQVVDKLGGVWMDVDRRYYHSNAGLSEGYRYAQINIKPGYQRLSGAAALAFVRYRHTDSDLYRNARQQLFVRSVKDQLSASFSLTSIPGLVRAIVSNVTVGAGGSGGKGPSSGTILRYANFAYTMPPGHVFQTRIENISGLYDLYAPPDAVKQAVNDFTTPDVEADIKAAGAAGVRVRRTRATGPRPADTTVVVLNGNGVPGSAADTSFQLHERGYQTLLPANNAQPNAPEQNHYKTEIFYNTAKPSAQAAAERLARLFGAANVYRSFPRDLRPLAGNAMTVVVVGRTFHGLAAVPQDRTPKHAPPAVLTDRAETLPQLRSIRRRVPFPVAVPSVIENASSLQGTPRVYEIAPGHKALRLTFKTDRDVGGYWGIEETDWPDAPVLGERSFRHFFKRRAFDFYFTGSHVHMIVVRNGRTTYWVVNTLLDTLSNETMIAIAKGLQPLGK
jgi:LCP family protein required for cell wall assembly